MSLKPYDVTVYDQTGLAARAIVKANPKVRVLSMYESYDPTGRIHIFGAGASQRFDVSNPESDSAKKRLFLLGASTSVICVADLSAISFMITALRLLLAEDIKKLVVISELPVEGLLGISEPAELIEFNKARNNGRLHFARKIVEPFDIHALSDSC